MRTVTYIVSGFMFVAVGVFALSFWMTHVPPVAASDGDLGVALNDWFDERHSQTMPQFNGAALVINNGETLVRGAWGHDGDGRELTPNSQFRLASVSKSFTSAAILKLASEGRLDLDSAVSRQIENCAVSASPAQLMSHTSNVADDYFDKADPDEITTISWVFDHVCTTTEKAEVPKPYSYNNTAYVFLAGLVERVSGQTFEAYLSEQVLAPLGMNRTRVWNLVSEDNFSSRATSFDENGKASPSNLDGVAGDGAVFSTLDDLANWAQFWRDNRLLPKELKDRATGRDAADGYHFGLVREGDQVSHNGGWLGARTFFGFKDSDIDADVVILLENGSSIYLDDLEAEIWKAISEE